MFPPCSMPSLPTIYSLSWRLWWKPLPPGAGVTAYPPGLRLVRKGLKRGEKADPGSLTLGIPLSRHLWAA
jgi:hypothetical protein